MQWRMHTLTHSLPPIPHIHTPLVDNRDKDSSEKTGDSEEEGREKKEAKSLYGGYSVLQTHQLAADGGVGGPDDNTLSQALSQSEETSRSGAQQLGQDPGSL